MKNLLIILSFLLPITLSAQLIRSYGVIEIGATFPTSTVTGAKFAYRTVDSSYYRWSHGNVWVKIVEPSIITGLTMPFDSVTFKSKLTDPVSRELKYSTDHETLMFGAGGTVIEIGQKEAWYVKNQSGSTIAKGTVVMAAGALGASGRILVAPMVSNGTVSAKYLLGIAATNIASGEDGYVIDFGKLYKMNTNSWNEGDVLYCSSTIPGALTNIEPAPPNLRLPIAFVINKHAVNGVLAVRIQTGNELHELHDVDTSGINTGEGLVYNSTSNKWQASSGKLITAVDTAAMLSKYIERGDTAAMLTNYVDGAGTATRIPILTGARTIGNSPALYNSTTKRWTWDSPSVLELPMGTDAQRPSPATTSDFWYSMTSNGIEWYNGTRWAKALESTINKGTSTRIPYFDANGQLTESANFAFSTNKIIINPTSNNVILNGGNATLTGVRNALIGGSAGEKLTTGYDNVFAGFGAGYEATTGYQNFFGGFLAGRNCIGCYNNVALGSEAGRSITNGNNNFFAGNRAGYTNTTGFSNNYLGNNSGYKATTAFYNNSFGSFAGYELTTGRSNNFFGEFAGTYITTGEYNNFFGAYAGDNSSLGASRNTAIGQYAGFSVGLANTHTGSDNTIIGSLVATNITGSASRNTAIGYNISLPSGTGNDQLVISNLIFGTGATGTGTTIPTGGRIGIKTASPTRELDVNGDLRVRDSTDLDVTPAHSSITGLLTRDATGWVGAATLGGGLSYSGGVLSSSVSSGTARTISYHNSAGARVFNTNFKLDTTTTAGTLGKYKLNINNPSNLSNDGDAYQVFATYSGDAITAAGMFTVGDQSATMGTVGYAPNFQLYRSGGNFSSKSNLSSGASLGAYSWRGQVSGSSTALGNISLSYLGNGTTSRSRMSLNVSTSGGIATGISIDSARTIQFPGYGTGTKEAGDISKTFGNVAAFATDGTVLDYRITRDTTADDVDFTVTSTLLSSCQELVITAQLLGKGSDLTITLPTPSATYKGNKVGIFVIDVALQKIVISGSMYYTTDPTSVTPTVQTSLDTDSFYKGSKGAYYDFVCARNVNGAYYWKLKQ